MGGMEALLHTSATHHIPRLVDISPSRKWPLSQRTTHSLIQTDLAEDAHMVSSPTPRTGSCSYRRRKTRRRFPTVFPNTSDRKINSSTRDIKRAHTSNRTKKKKKKRRPNPPLCPRLSGFGFALLPGLHHLGAFGLALRHDLRLSEIGVGDRSGRVSGPEGTETDWGSRGG